MSIALQLLCGLSVCCAIASGACPTAPFEGAKRPGDNGYRLVFSEDVVKYVPGRIYNREIMDTKHNDILINPYHTQCSCLAPAPPTSTHTIGSPSKRSRPPDRRRTPCSSGRPRRGASDVFSCSAMCRPSSTSTASIALPSRTPASPRRKRS